METKELSLYWHMCVVVVWASSQGICKFKLRVPLQILKRPAMRWHMQQVWEDKRSGQCASGLGTC